MSIHMKALLIALVAVLVGVPLLLQGVLFLASLPGYWGVFVILFIGIPFVYFEVLADLKERK